MRPMQGPVRAPHLLGVGAFAVGTCELVLAGLLPELGSSLGVSVATAGQVVTVFGVTAAIAGPVLAASSVRWARRRVLLLALGLYLVGTALSAAAGTFGVLLGGQVLAACGAGLFLPTATVTAAALEKPERRGRAVAIVTTGMTVAIAVGAPLGTALAAIAGWRATMLMLTGLALLVGVAVLAWIPPVQAAPDELAGLRERLKPLVDRRVLALLATTLAAFTAIYIPYTYISVVAQEATGGDGLQLASILVVLGVAGIAGNLLAGRLADRVGGRPVVAGSLIGLVIVFLMTPYWSTTLPAALVAAAAYGVIGFGVSAPQTYRILSLGGQTSLSVALNGAALYLAISLSGLLGAAVLTALDVRWLGVIAAVTAGVALLLSELAQRVDIRSRARAV
ncbi:MFS transporter [Pseudonocardia sp. McavD-2-B]|uniref:MFS transporter n=1 Tax=Pseudonocardia sp. McavD-2-B TaxID=2954499 RepID=UPI0027E2C784|nr:MFS transporter [Pseudonocardia sp. McavD-2-B]